VLDFFTQQDAPVEITIDGTVYKLPRFGLDEMIERSATIRRETADMATEHLTPDDKARFLTFFQPPAIDHMDMARWCLSSEGLKHVAERQMKLAGVPDEIRASLLKRPDDQKLYALVAELTTAPRAMVQMKGDGEKSPLTQQPAGSGDSGAAPSTTKSPSDKPTPASTAAA
jgi:hypothetical protein